MAPETHCDLLASRNSTCSLSCSNNHEGSDNEMFSVLLIFISGLTSVIKGLLLLHKL